MLDVHTSITAVACCIMLRPLPSHPFKPNNVLSNYSMSANKYGTRIFVSHGCIMPLAVRNDHRCLHLENLVSIHLMGIDESWFVAKALHS